MKQSLLLMLLLASPPAVSAPADISDQVEVRGRFSYVTEFDRESSPFPWNASSQSAADLTRLMIDLSTRDATHGRFYLKGSAMWDGDDALGESKRLRFDQADYFWHRASDHSEYSVRAFANERRFFVNDGLAPLVDDEGAGTTGGNRGIRFDGRPIAKLSATGIFSFLGDDIDESRRIGFLRAAWSLDWGTFSASYLLDNPKSQAPENRATFKTEIAGGYKKAHALVAYYQSGRQTSDFFFPNARWKWNRLGDGVRDLLPPGAAMTAEARLGNLVIGESGAVRLVYRYDLAGSEFQNDLVTSGTGRIRHTAAAYAIARKVSLNGRLRFLHTERFEFNSEKSRVWEAGAWGHLKNGIGFVGRAAYGDFDDPFGDRSNNFVHVAVRQENKRIASGVHVMWLDLDSVFSERRLAWDGKIALSPDFGFNWRAILTRDFEVDRAVFARIEFRPSDRVFATLSYGRSFLGDDPFLVEDTDLTFVNPTPDVYTITLRGDF